MPVNACDAKVSILSSLLLPKIRILSCFFFLFLVMLNICFPVVREKIKLKLALAIPAGAPKTLADEIIRTPLLVTLKTIKNLSM